MKITPLIKGLITGLVLVGFTLLVASLKLPGSSPVNYLYYVLFAGGIAWTLIAYSRSGDYTGKFGDIFGQGFRCFIIVTLVMTAYMYILIKTNPGLVEEAAQSHREYLIKNEKSKTPAEIDAMVAEGKKQFTTSNISATIFSTLIIGSLFTAAGAGLLTMRRR